MMRFGDNRGMSIYSFSPYGYEGTLVKVEIDLRRGIPGVNIVGLADNAVKESRERMRAAIRNSGFDFPLEHVLVSLSPADLKKEGAGFDLAVALAVLAANESGGGDDAQNSPRLNSPRLNSPRPNSPRLNSPRLYADKNVLVMGELQLSGAVCPVKAVNAAAATARDAGFTHCIVGKANASEAQEAGGMKVFGASTLQDAFDALCRLGMADEPFTQQKTAAQDECTPPGSVDIGGVMFGPIEDKAEFGEIIGQANLVRGLQIAAAGGHNVFAVGAPGCGKTMAIRKFPSLLPLLTLDEAQTVTRIYSLAGLISAQEPLVRVAPFRSPHQGASQEGICGGGAHCLPGEISLAHNGALFLDEAAEFHPKVLQSLRVPLEAGEVTISRAGRASTYPASFQLLMAANPCPCGNMGSSVKMCMCSTRSIELYWKKFSMPLLDRMDIRMLVRNEIAEDSAQDLPHSKSTSELRVDIARAVKRQRTRQGKKNARLTDKEMNDFCPMTVGARAMLNMAAVRAGFSQRAVASCIKIARTIADMADSDTIEDAHIKEAISYRRAASGFFPSAGE